MVGQQVIDTFPLWVLFIVTVTLIMVAVETGIWIGRVRRREVEKRGGKEGESSPTGTVIGAMLGLLAFMLGFTFSIAATRFEDRRSAVIQETNAVGTTYLRARLLAEPYGGDIRKLLRQYVDLRVGVMTSDPTPERVTQAIAESEKIQQQVWSRTVDLVKDDLKSPVDALFITSLNEMIDCHTLRVVAGRNRIPFAVWGILYTIAVLSMGALGVTFGYSGKGGTGLNLVMALVLGAVIVLVADLDRPMEGTLRVSQSPMIDLQQSINSNPQ